MRRFLLAFFLIAPLSAHSSEEGYEYTYLALGATHSESIGYKGELSVGIPALPFYVRAATQEEDVKTSGNPYTVSTELLSFGVHASVTEILNGISKGGLSFSFDTFLDVYAEIGATRWEVEDSLKAKRDGNDAYVRAGIKMGDPTTWEYDFFVEKTKLAELVLDPATNTSSYSLSSETNNNIGINVTTHFGNNFATSVGFNNDSFSGSTIALGVRLSF